MISFNKHRCFSLVELLIILTILAILSSLLLPSLNKTFASVRNIECKNNLKQINLGMQIYLSDFNDFIPLNEDAMNGYERWHHNLSKSGYFPALESYSGSAPPESIFACPEAFPGGYNAPNVQKKGTDYGKNLWTGYRNVYVSIKRATIPSSTYFIGDTGSPTTTSNSSTLYINSNQPNLRHDFMWNCLYLDGHVNHLDDYEENVSFNTPAWVLYDGQPFPQ